MGSVKLFVAQFTQLTLHHRFDAGGADGVERLPPLMGDHIDHFAHLRHLGLLKKEEILLPRLLLQPFDFTQIDENRDSGGGIVENIAVALDQNGNRHAVVPQRDFVEGGIVGRHVSLDLPGILLIQKVVDGVDFLIKIVYFEQLKQ